MNNTLNMLVSEWAPNLLGQGLILQTQWILQSNSRYGFPVFFLIDTLKTTFQHYK